MEKLKRLSLFICSVVAAVITVLLLSQCSFEDPSVPTWDVRFTLPLLSKTYTMVDLADELKELSIDEHNQVVLLNLEEEIKTVNIGDHLRVAGVNKEIMIVGGSVVDSIGIPADIVVVDSGRIKEGYIYLEIENQSNNPLNVNFETQDLIDPDGIPLSIDEAIIPGVGEITHFNFQLKDYIFLPSIHGGQNYVRFEVSLTGELGIVIFRLIMTDLILSSVTGILNNLEVAIDSTENELGIPEEFKDFMIQSANLKLALVIGVLFPIDIDIKIEAVETRKGTIPPPILIQRHIITIDPTGIDTIDVGDATEFINSHPTEILTSGRIYVGDGATSATISEDHVFKGTAIFQAPLTLTIPAYETKMEVDTLDLDEDTRETIRDNLVKANFVVDVNSRLPLGASVSILFSSTVGDSMIYESGNSDLRFDLQLKSAPTTGDPGIVSGSEQSTFNIELDKDDLRLFEENEEIYLGFRFVFYSDTAMVSIRPVDSIDIRAHISALIHTKTPE